MKEKSLVFSALVCIVILVSIFQPAAIHAQGPLILGVPSFLSSTEIYKRFSPLADHLSDKLGRPVKILIEGDYSAHMNRIKKGEVDIALLGPASYVRFTSRFGRIPLLAAFESKGHRTYKGVIVVKKGSPITSLSQLKGKKFAFSDINSTMGHLVPRYMLLKAGVDVKDLGKHAFLDNHENVALGVLSGAFDAGAVRENVYHIYSTEGLIALAMSGPMPDHVFAARRGLPETVRQKVSQILLSLKDTEAGRVILSSLQKDLTALVAVRDSDYDPVRIIVDSLAHAGVKP